MKLRINNNNSIRLRLSQSDISRLNEAGCVSVTLQVGSGRFTYQLKRADISAIDADLTDNRLAVTIPDTLARRWADSEEVGFDATLASGDTPLYILIEKDFQCLMPRKEDESDLYINPKATTHE